MRKLSYFLVVIMIFSATGVFASGLAIPEQGAAAMGMSAAMTARSQDLSSIFYNPAGLDYVDGFELMLGITPIMPSHDYSPFNYTPYNNKAYGFSKQDSESNTFLPPQIYAAYRATDTIVLGLGVNAPFGLGTEWNKEWDGRYASTFAEIQAVYITPTISYQASDMVTVGAGISYVTSTATIEKMIDTGSALYGAAAAHPTLGALSPALAGMMHNTDNDSEFSLEGDGTGIGYNLGVIIRPIENYQFGISYRGAMDIEYDGTAKFTHQNANNTAAMTAALNEALVANGMDAATAAATAAGSAAALDAGVSASMPASQTGTATLSLPWQLNLGMLKQINEVWDVSAEVNIVGWEVYEELTIDFDDDLPYDKSTMEKNWENSYVYRLGTSYQVNERLTARGGLMYDFNPVPNLTFDGQLPDSDRYSVSIGAGYKLGVLQLDCSYLLLKFLEREKMNGVGYGVDTTGNGIIDRFDVPDGYPVANGKYSGMAHLLSVSLSYNF
ncbi:OmpP1/FadL family transporter [Candidatus Latescibacterota bacterium]